jgi:hypothetical protein
MCALLLVQYGLGIGVNLFVTLPGRDHGAGLGAAIANGPVAVFIHAVLGLALIVVALATAVRAALSSAAINGIRFVGTGQNGASMAMALGWAVALLCYLSIMYIASRPARR